MFQRLAVSALTFLFVYLALDVTRTQASVTAPQRSLRWLGGRQVWVPLCSRRGVNGSAAWFDSTNTTIMDQQACISPSWGTVTALKLVFAAFDMSQQGEEDRALTASGTASIFVPSLNSTTVVGGAGVASGSLTLNSFVGNGYGANGISLGQVVSSSGGGIASSSYVAAVANSFVAGSGNSPINTNVTLNVGTTAATANGQPFTFAGLLTPVKFGGKRNFSIEPGHDVVTSDPISVELTPSTWFLVRTSALMSGAGMQLMDMPYTSRLTIPGTSYTEFDSRGTTVNDQTMNPSALSNTGGGYWGPVTLLAQVTASPNQTPPGAALILGDSIAAGTGDVPDALGLEGYVQRSLEGNMPFITAARGSTTALGLLAHGDGQYALSIDTGITDILLELGRNDIEQFSSLAMKLEATLEALVARYAVAGRRVWCFTIPPTTYSNDGWITAANQAFPVATNYTGSSTIASGSVQISMASVGNLATGQEVGLNLPVAGAIAVGSVIVSVNSTTSTITISAPTTGILAAGTKLYFGSSIGSASPVEVQRTAYNAFLRGNLGQSGCIGLIDVDSVVSDQINLGRWRTDLGQGSVDGVHPSAALHQAAVTADIITPSMFSVP